MGDISTNEEARLRPGLARVMPRDEPPLGTVVSRIGWDDPYTVIGRKNEGNGRGFTVKVRDEAGGIHHFRAWRLEPWGGPAAERPESADIAEPIEVQIPREAVDFEFQVGDLVAAAGTRLRFHVAAHSRRGEVVEARSLNGGVHYFRPDLLERVPVIVGDCAVEL